MTRWAWLLLAACCAWLMFGVPALANAATYSTSCPTSPADPTCDALAERLEAQVVELEAQTALLTSIDANTAGGGPTTVAGTVALSSDDRERLDLGWYGTWAVVGLLLVLLVAPYFLSLLRVERGL